MWLVHSASRYEKHCRCSCLSRQGDYSSPAVPNVTTLHGCHSYVEMKIWELFRSRETEKKDQFQYHFRSQTLKQQAVNVMLMCSSFQQRRHWFSNAVFSFPSLRRSMANNGTNSQFLSSNWQIISILGAGGTFVMGTGTPTLASTPTRAN